MIVITQNITHLLHGIVEIIIAKLICIKLIDNIYKHEPKKNSNLKKTLIIYNTNEYFNMIVKLNITFTTSNKKMEKKCHPIQ